MQSLSQPQEAVSGNIIDMKPETIEYTPQNLREARKRRRLSQDDLANAIGTKRATIQNCERKGANPTIKTIKALGKVLNVVFQIDYRTVENDEAPE